MDELNELPLSELTARRAASLAKHAELKAKGAEARTFAESTQMRELAKEIVEIDKITVAIYEDEVADIPVAPVAPVVKSTEEVLPEGAKITPVASAPASENQNEKLVQVADEKILVESIAASAALAEALITRPTVAPDNNADRARSGDNRVVVAAAGFGPEGIEKGKGIDLDAVKAIIERRGGDRNPGREELTILDVQASVQPVLSPNNSPQANTAALAAWIERQKNPEDVQAAAFTICGPPDILRSVPTDCVDDTRYVDSWFGSVPTEHGAIQFYRPLGMADVSTSTVVWGQAEQAAIDPSDPSTWKPCATIPCLPTVTVGVEEIVQCLTVPAFQYMTSKESVGSAMAATRALFARTADGHLLKLYDVLASKYTMDASTGVGGAFIKIYDLLGRIAGVVSAVDRRLDLAGYTLGIEAGMMAALSLDSTMACNPRGASEAAAELFGGLGFDRIGVTPDWSLADGGGPYTAVTINDPANAAAAIFARPTSYKIRIFDSSDFAVLSPGSEALGIIPDLNNMRQNKLSMFGKTYQGLAKLGCKPAFRIAVTNLASTGVRAACA